jgi:PAS domain S-box-containing protein
MTDGTPGKKDEIKRMLKELHECEDPAAVRERFKDLLRETSTEEIAQVEEELIQEGMTREQLHGMCELHLEVFKEAVEGAGVDVPPGHPVAILMEEHTLMLDIAARLKKAANEAASAKGHAEARPHVHACKGLVADLRGAESHYLREENVLFPYLERHGVTEPPKIMWMEHDQVRATKKELFATEARFGPGADIPAVAKHLGKLALELAELLSSHFYKENHILYPMGLKHLSGEEWAQVRAEFDGIGYTPFTPPRVPFGEAIATAAPPAASAGMVPLEPGPLTLEELTSILNSLPVDISFVDAEGRVRYFNETPERIFTRTRAVIGRTVQGCHPDKSLHAVNRILEDFKAAKRESAEFWIPLGGKMVHIRYFPVRSREGKYLGCLEVTQDIAPLQRLTGQNRLLD